MQDELHLEGALDLIETPGGVGADRRPGRVLGPHRPIRAEVRQGRCVLARGGQENLDVRRRCRRGEPRSSVATEVHRHEAGCEPRHRHHLDASRRRAPPSPVGPLPTAQRCRIRARHAA